VIRRGITPGIHRWAARSATLTRVLWNSRRMSIPNSLCPHRDSQLDPGQRERTSQCVIDRDQGCARGVMTFLTLAGVMQRTLSSSAMGHADCWGSSVEAMENTTAIFCLRRMLLFFLLIGRALDERMHAYADIYGCPD
jgi:hypothetical protein